MIIFLWITIFKYICLNLKIKVETTIIFKIRFIERKQNESNSNIVFFTNSKKSGNFAQTIEEIYNKNIAC